MACEEETRVRVDAMKRQTLTDLSRIRQGRRAAELYHRGHVGGAGGAAVDRRQ